MIKVCYSALLEIEEEIDSDYLVTVDDIRANARSGLIEKNLTDLIAKGLCNPKITISQQYVDIQEVTS